MTSKPQVDHGQTLTAPKGKVIGFLDEKVEFEAFTDALSAAGYPAKTITTLCGEDGIQLLERLQANSFFFGDSEDSIIQLSIRELKQGHYAVAVEVTDRQQAVEIASLAAPHGGHRFTYFGTWENEQLPT
jgi:hypothetical protein